jgi:hypothetical protein
MTEKQETLQQPFLSNSLAHKRVFLAVRYTKSKATEDRDILYNFQAKERKK